MGICNEIISAVAGVGTRLWVDLRGDAAPRLTADRKTALPREDIADWPSVFEGVLQRWCRWLQKLLNHYTSRLASGLLSSFFVKSMLRPIVSATPQLSRWQLETTDSLAKRDGRWFTALLTQQITISAHIQGLGCTLTYDLARDFARARDFALDFIRTYGFGLKYYVSGPARLC